MKKCTTFLLALSMSSALMVSRPANAGITSMFNSMALMGEDPAVGLLASALSVGLVFGGVQMVNYNIPGGKYLGIALIILDASPELETTALQEHLAHTFPFIDNSENLFELASAVQTEIQAEGLLHVSKTVGLDPEKVREILDDSSLTEAQLDFVCETLR